MDAQATVVRSFTPIVVSMELQATGVGESTLVEVLSPELQMVVSCDMAKKNRSLSMEEHVFIEFLVTQVASLSSSLAAGMACEDLPTCHFGVVSDNKPNMLVATCNASFAGGEGCGEAWA
jgi:hypothetical protein